MINSLREEETEPTTSRANGARRACANANARDPVPRRRCTKREEAIDGERLRFLVMRTVGRQAVCRDTGITPLLGRRETRWWYSRGRALAFTRARRGLSRAFLLLVGPSCCHLAAVLVN